MPLKTIRISSKSGDVIPDGTGARVRVMFYDEMKTDRRADLTDEEIEKLLPFTDEVEPRPRGQRRRLRRDED